VTGILELVIKTFRDKATKKLFEMGKTSFFPREFSRRAIRRLEYIHLAKTLEDLRVPPSNRFPALSGNRRGQYAISINDQWRICFRFVNGDAYDVEITDYH
jgi:toxin HigB-1